MRNWINIILLFLTFMTLFVIWEVIPNTISNYKSLKSIDDYTRIKVKIDSAVHHSSRGSKGGTFEHFDLFYNGNEKPLQLTEKKRYLFADSLEKKKYSQFLKTDRDSIFIWTSDYAKPIYSLPNHEKLDNNLLKRRFRVGLYFIIISAFLYLRVIYMLIVN